MSQAFAALAAAVALAGSPALAAEPPRVVASISPVGSLAAMVMRGVAEPSVLLPPGASPHVYSLRPSEARALANADLILWVGETLETFLEDPIENLVQKDRVVELMETEELMLLPTRKGGVWEAHHDHGEHGHDKEHAHAKEHAHNDKHSHDKHGHDEKTEHDHDHGAVDAHIWLDPRNAAVIVDRIASVLAKRDPSRAETYRANAAAAKSEIEALDGQIAAALASVRDRPYVVFHDAYQYLEQHYGLSPIGSVTVGPERAPGAQRLAHLREEIVERGAVCVFREPQFSPRVLESLVAETGIRIGVLDPEGAEVPPGPDGYAQLMRKLADSLAGCLAAG